MRALSASLLVGLLAIAGLASPARGNDPGTPQPKSSSFAPHAGGRHVYGAPIQRPILHKRHKAGRPAHKTSPPPPPR